MQHGNATHTTSLVLFVLVSILVLGSAGAAYAVTPTVIAADGASAFSYQDLQDLSAKREGGYAAFDNTEFVGDYDDPHGGYDTTTNKCKVCHAVHRAEGAYYLLRADSQDDACDYCHIGGSAHSSKVVYDFGKYTTNGHTIGASTAIPDSTINQWAEAVTLSSVDAAMNPISEDIEVRAYDATKASMYRFTRHHGHGSWGTGRSGYGKVGPLSLRCMNCHQTHNATAQIWRPYDIDIGTGQTSDTRSTGYKLLKLFPSGSTTGSANTYGNYEPGQVVKAPEATLTAGVTYSDNVSAEFTVVDDFGSEYAAPVWIAQHIGPDAGDEYGSDRDANAVNTAALSVWCADCHNLNIGGSHELTNVELGFRAHTERTHPAPLVGAFDGPAQCYTCHRADLPRIAAGAACSQCHYGTGNYAANRFDSLGSGYVDSDFPHGGESGGYKLLGTYSVDVAGLNPTTIDESVTIGPDNLDAVCLRCHWVEENYHDGAVGGDGHSVPAAYTSCTAAGCHTAGDAVAIHASTPSGCNACHTAVPLTNDCGTCHPDKLAPHGYDALQHTATPGSDWIMIFAAGTHDSAMIGDGGVVVDCDTCHNTELGPVHQDACGTCHPTPVDTLSTWSGGCQEGGCHTTYHAESRWSHYPPPGAPTDCNVCHVSPGWEVPASSCANCHVTYNPGDTTPPVTTSNASASYVGAATIDFTVRDGGLVGVDTTYFRVDGGPVLSGSRATVVPPGAHTLEFWSVDQAGNEEWPHNTVAFTVTADTTPPATTSNTQPTYYYYAAQISLTATDWASSSGVKATYYSLDGGPTQTGTHVTVPAPSGEITHTLEYWSEDWSGNVESVNTDTFTVIGGTGTIRFNQTLVAGEWVEWLVWRGPRSGPEDYSVLQVGPYSGYEDLHLPVSAQQYYITVSWGDPSEPYDEFNIGYVTIDSPDDFIEY